MHAPSSDYDYCYVPDVVLVPTAETAPLQRQQLHPYLHKEVCSSTVVTVGHCSESKGNSIN
jgi:hypothetical protein